MPIPISSALAVTFPLSGTSNTVTLAFSTAPSPVVATLPAQDYRVLLGSSVVDILQVLESTINAALAPRSSTVAVTMGATGRVTLTFSETVTMLTWGNDLGKLLGFSAVQSFTFTVLTAGAAPKYLMLFVSRASSNWTPKTPMAAAETAGGLSYGVTSGIVRAEDEFTFEFIPRDPDVATATGQTGTPWEPAAAQLASIGTHLTMPWGIVDSLACALGRTCALARGNFQAMRSSTTERFDLVAIRGSDLAAPRASYQFPPWEAYMRLSLGMIRQSATPTGTRA